MRSRWCVLVTLFVFVLSPLCAAPAFAQQDSPFDIDLPAETKEFEAQLEGAPDAAGTADVGASGDAGTLGARSARSAAKPPGATSFGDQFFLSRKMTPGSGEKQIELLGSAIIWFLLLLSGLSIGLIFMMSLTNQRKSILPPGIVAEARGLLATGNYREAFDLVRREQSFFSQILAASLTEATHGYGAMIRALEQTSEELTTERLRRIEYLNVLGQVSPMIGLFGTVYGMILAFHSIVASGGNADPVLLAGGIGTALTTTFWGLVVAIPALAGYALVRNKVDSLTSEATVVAEELVNQFRPKPGRTATRLKSDQGSAA